MAQLKLVMLRRFTAPMKPLAPITWSGQDCHATCSPEEGANKLSLALTVITEGVTFNAEGNDLVKLLIVLAATDSTSHIEAISQLAQLFDNDNDVQALLNAKTQQDILSVIARY